MMVASNTPDESARSSLLPRRRWARFLVIGAFVVAALAVRFDRISSPPMDYHAERIEIDCQRQYRSALIARAFYYRDNESIPKWEREVAAANLVATPFLEPPIIEHLSACVYAIVGGEHLWLARSWSILFWVIGGAFLHSLVRRVASRDAAFLSTVLYLFAPYGIQGSRGLIPGPLLIFSLLVSLWTIYSYSERQSWGWLVGAAAVSAVAVFLKPGVNACPVFVAFIALMLQHEKSVARCVRWRYVFFFVVVAIPTLFYVTHRMFSETYIHWVAERNFRPSLYLYPLFWHGWLEKIGSRIGFPLVAGGLLGAFLCPVKRFRAMLLGLWIGYIVLGLTFSWKIYTHDRYQLMLIPISALSLVPLIKLLLDWLRHLPNPRWQRLVTWSALVVMILVSVEPLVWERANPKYQHDIAVRKEIGTVVNHSMKTISLDYYYGAILTYHAKLAGSRWYTRGDLKVLRDIGLPDMSAEERLDKMIREEAPEFFIIGWLGEYREQPDLAALLERRYAVYQETRDYIIFDMRQRLDMPPDGDTSVTCPNGT
ncbi:MAG: glycosyltransferase family 39 protein [Verrucomicrobia bacterium]|nr:glycosyltransferase family 39 protein [Verrucomicrobiota bacterium]